MSSGTPPSTSWFVRFRQRLHSVLLGSATKRHWQRRMLFLLLLLTLLVGPNGALTSMAVLAPPSQPKPPVTPLTPMTQDQALANQAKAWGHASGAQQTLAQLLATGPHTDPTSAIIPRQVVTPQPAATGSVTLSATSATTLTTSDGQFSLDIPVGSLTSSDLAADGGPLTLQVTQLAGPVGGGSSGHVRLGDECQLERRAHCLMEKSYLGGKNAS